MSAPYSYKGSLQAKWRALQLLQLAIHEELSQLQNQMSSLKIEELVDIGFFCRRMEEISNSLRRDCEGRVSIIGRTLAAYVGAEALRGNEVNLSGEFATATPTIREKPKMPSNDSPEMRELLRWIGVSDEVINKGYLRPSFSQLEAELTRRLETGEKPPPGIQATFREVSAVFRQKRGKKQDEF
jgi:hypothetical protein